MMVAQTESGVGARRPNDVPVMAAAITPRFWPVQRDGRCTVFDAEARLDLQHLKVWTTGDAEFVADSLNRRPSGVVAWDWAGAEVFTSPDDLVPPALCVASGGHFFGEADACAACEFRPEVMAQ